MIATSDFDENCCGFFSHYIPQLKPSVASLSDKNNQDYFWIIPLVHGSFITHT